MKDNKVRVPRDVEEYINKKRAIRITAFVVVEIMLAALLIFVIFDYVVASNYPELSFVLYLLVMLLPIHWFKIPFWMFDKTFAGEIIHKSEEDYIAADNNKTVVTGRLHVNRRQDFMIRRDDGKVIQYTVYDNRARHAFRRTTYNVGDRVIHVGGTHYLQAVAVGDDDTLICAICGAESRADTPICHVCGKTLKIN